MSAPPPPAKKKTGLIVTIVAAVVAVFLVIPCLAAIAIPAFVGYVARSKTAEAEMNLRTLYQGAAAYYAAEHVGPSGEVLTRCTVGAGRTPNVPGPHRSVIDVEQSSAFGALGFTPRDPIHYQYEIVGPGRCGHGPGETLYSFRARGDLDGDGVQSLFELTAGSDGSNELFRSAGIYKENELE